MGCLSSDQSADMPAEAASIATQAAIAECLAGETRQTVAAWTLDVKSLRGYASPAYEREMGRMIEAGAERARNGGLGGRGKAGRSRRVCHGRRDGNGRGGRAGHGGCRGGRLGRLHVHVGGTSCWADHGWNRAACPRLYRGVLAGLHAVWRGDGVLLITSAQAITFDGSKRVVSRSLGDSHFADKLARSL